MAVPRGFKPLLGYIGTASPANIDGLNFQVAVPKYMQLQMKPPSSTTVPANGGGKATQVFRIVNSLHGQKPASLDAPPATDRREHPPASACVPKR